MAAMDDATLARKVAVVMDSVFSYLFNLLIIKGGGRNTQRGVVCKLIFIKIGYLNKMVLRVKNGKK